MALTKNNKTYAKTLFMFPGQGAQQVGMGKNLAQKLPQVAQLYQKANELLGYDLAKMCFNGPIEKLNTTEISQPAIFVTSAACLMAIRHDDDNTEPEPDACAGLSLGEYTALYAAGAVGFEDALKLVQLRGKAMQTAASKYDGAMVSILGLDSETVEQLCNEAIKQAKTPEDRTPTVLKPVNFNCPGQIVISGNAGACQYAVELAEKFGAIKAIPLQVAGAFHTEMVADAAEQLSKALDKCTFKTPKCAVVANVDAQPYNSSNEIPDKLLKQLTNPVRWQQSIEWLLDEQFDRFVEIGPGKVLSGLVKKTARPKKLKVSTVNVNANDQKM